MEVEVELPDVMPSPREPDLTPRHGSTSIDCAQVSINAAITIRKLSTMIRRAYYRELLVYLLFLIIFSFSVTLVMSVHPPFLQNSALVDILFKQEMNVTNSLIQKTFFDVTTETEMWQWITDTFTSGILADNWIIPHDLCKDNPSSVSACDCSGTHCEKITVTPTASSCNFDDHFMMGFDQLAGPIRFRTLRLDDKECSGMNNEPFQNCRSASSTKQPYGANCDPENPNTTDCYMYSEHVGWYVFRPEYDPGYLDLGFFRESGGYVVESFPSLSAFQEVTSRLQNDYFDEFTKVMEISFNVYNPNADTVTVVEIIFTLSNAGYISQNYRTFSLVLDTYGDKSIGVGVCQILYVIALVYFVKEEIREFRMTGVAYFNDFWNLVEWISLLLNATLVIVWCVYLKAIRDLDFKPNESCEFQNTFYAARLYSSVSVLCGVTFFFCLMKINKFLKFNSRLHVLWRTLLNAALDIFSFLIICMLIMFAFGFWSYFSYGPFLASFHSFGSSVSTLFRMLLGDLEYRSMTLTHPFLSPIFVALYGVVVIFIVVNVFISIITEWYNFSKGLQKRQKRDKPVAEDAVDYDLWKQIKRWWFFKTAFRLGLTRSDLEIRLEKGVEYTLVFDKPYLEGTSKKCAVLSSTMLSIIKPDAVIVLGSGVCLQVVRFGLFSVDCIVTRPGSFTSYEMLWLENNILTKGFGVPILRLMWFLHSLTTRRLLSHTKRRFQQRHMTKGEDHKKRTARIKNKLGFRFTIEVPHIDWKNAYTTSVNKLKFTLNDLLVVMRTYMDHRSNVNDVRLSYHRLVNLLIEYDLQQVRRPTSFKTAVSRLTRKSTGESNNSDSKLHQKHFVSLDLIAPSPDNDEETVHMHTDLTVTTTLTVEQVVEMCELALVLMIRFGDWPRTIPEVVIASPLFFVPRTMRQSMRAEANPNRRASIRSLTSRPSVSLGGGPGTTEGGGIGIGATAPAVANLSEVDRLQEQVKQLQATVEKAVHALSHEPPKRQMSRGKLNSSRNFMYT
eukprot:c6950_g1_i1.p1 GENE.c6950_g1_i1~~c6950_g1_i1.p1  ORF type:complete len:1010 (-),score=269.80 c6950_g1_i1:99-3128(-)